MAAAMVAVEADMMGEKRSSRSRSQKLKGKPKGLGGWGLPEIATSFQSNVTSSVPNSGVSSQATSPHPDGMRKRNAKRMKWTKEEDEHMLRLITQHGLKQWNVIAAELPGRTGKQCRERWHNQLDPSLKRGPWSVEEENILIAAHAKHGNKWSDIAAMLPGRTDNSIKNHWNSAKRRLMRYLFGNSDEVDGREDARGQKRGFDAVDADEEDEKGLKYRRKRPRALDIFAKMQVPVPSPVGSNSNANVSVSDLLDDSAMMGMVLGSTRLSTEKLLQALTYPPPTDVSDAASCLKALQTSALSEAPEIENAGEAAAKLIAASPTPPAFIAKLDLNRSTSGSSRTPTGGCYSDIAFDFEEACARLERRKSSSLTVEEDLETDVAPASLTGAVYDTDVNADQAESPMELLAQACMPAEKGPPRNVASSAKMLTASNSIDTASDSVESKTDTEGRADCESLALSEA